MHPDISLLHLDFGELFGVLGRLYLTRQAAALLRFANSTSDPKLAAALVERAAQLKSLADERASSRPDPSPYPPDVEDDTR